jgi:hypothetical protein
MTPALAKRLRLLASLPLVDGTAKFYEEAYRLFDAPGTMKSDSK